MYVCDLAYGNFSLHFDISFDMTLLNIEQYILVKLVGKTRLCCSVNLELFLNEKLQYKKACLWCIEKSLMCNLGLMSFSILNHYFGYILANIERDGSLLGHGADKQDIVLSLLVKLGGVRIRKRC